MAWTRSQSNPRTSMSHPTSFAQYGRAATASVEHRLPHRSHRGTPPGPTRPRRRRFRARRGRCADTRCAECASRKRWERAVETRVRQEEWFALLTLPVHASTGRAPGSAPDGGPRLLDSGRGRPHPACAPSSAPSPVALTGGGRASPRPAVVRAVPRPGSDGHPPRPGGTVPGAPGIHRASWARGGGRRHGPGRRSPARSTVDRG
jgi:hypothetical protein